MFSTHFNRPKFCFKRDHWDSFTILRPLKLCQWLLWSAVKFKFDKSDLEGIEISIWVFRFAIVEIAIKKVTMANPCYVLTQACTTYGPRAKCGPRKLLIWPAKLQILFVQLAFFLKPSFLCVTTCNIWPLNINKKNVWPAMRLELCTPVLDNNTLSV